MTKKVILLIFLIIFICGSAEGGQNVLVLQSMKIKPYEDALRGFKDMCPCSITELIVSELNCLNIVDIIRGIKPDIILTIGIDALLSVKGIKNIPVIYLMVLNPESMLSPEEKNITGVSMRISAEKQLDVFQKLMPDIKKIGILFDPSHTGVFVKEAQRAAGEIGLELITEEVYHPRQVLSLMAINDMKSKINAFWMLPDTSVICSETVEFLLLFSIENKIPIITFSDKYVEMGALMTLNIEAFKLGEQAGRMADKILSGKAIDVSAAKAEEIILSINLKAAENLGVKFSNTFVQNLDIITVNGEIINKTRIAY